MQTETTGQMSPAMEAEVNHVKDIFSKAVNAIVDASNLRAELDALRSSFESLKSDLEYVRSRNRELDANLHDVRTQRDEAQRKLAEANDSLNQVSHERDNYRLSAETNEATIRNLREQINRLTKERDDAIMAQLNAEESAKRDREQLADIRDYAARMFGLRPPEPVKPEATTPIASPEPQQAPTNEPEADKPWWNR